MKFPAITEAKGKIVVTDFFYFKVIDGEAYSYATTVYGDLGYALGPIEPPLRVKIALGGREAAERHHKAKVILISQGAFE